MIFSEFSSARCGRFLYTFLGGFLCRYLLRFFLFAFFYAANGRSQKSFGPKLSSFLAPFSSPRQFPILLTSWHGNLLIKFGFRNAECGINEGKDFKFLFRIPQSAIRNSLCTSGQPTETTDLFHRLMSQRNGIRLPLCKERRANAYFHSPSPP